MKQIIVITGASSGFGALTARSLALASHTVYASMRETKGRNAAQVEEVEQYAAEHKADLRTIELDVASQESCDSAIQEIIAKAGRLDVVIHNAGHMVFGPSEAFTPEQLAELYDVNVLSTQRMNRAALPVLRKQGKGLVIWVGSSSTRGGTPPYLAPYFAAKAGMDALAVSYAGELARWNIETTTEYEAGPTANLTKQIMKGFELTAVPNADVSEVAKAIVKVVDMPFGTRPFRAHIDPANDGAEIVNGVADRVRAELLRNMKLADLLRPSSTQVPAQQAS